MGSLFKESEFKGQPLGALYRNKDDRFPLQLGVRKVKLILEHIDELNEFYEKHEPQT